MEQSDGALSGVVPFRLTRNICQFLNELHIGGPFCAVLTSVAMCLHHYKDQLQHLIAIYLRDDLTEWQQQQEQRSTSTNSGEVVVDVSEDVRVKLKSSVNQNLTMILDTIKHVAPVPPADKVFIFVLPCVTDRHQPQSLFTIPLNQRITELISASRNTQKISSLPPTWMPWF
jgi:hypothetical protein